MNDNFVNIHKARNLRAIFGPFSTFGSRVMALITDKISVNIPAEVKFDDLQVSGHKEESSRS